MTDEIRCKNFLVLFHFVIVSCENVCVNVDSRSIMTDLGTLSGFICTIWESFVSFDSISEISNIFFTSFLSDPSFASPVSLQFQEVSSIQSIFLVFI